MKYKKVKEIKTAISKIDLDKKDKLEWAINRVITRIDKIIDSKNEEVMYFRQDLTNKYASVDSEKNIIYDTIGENRFHKFTGPNSDKFAADFRKFIADQDESEVELLPYICSDDSWKRIIDPDTFDLLKGVVIPVDAVYVEPVFTSLDGSTKPPDPRPQEPKKE